MRIRTFLPLAVSAALVSLAGCSPHDAGTANPQPGQAAGHSTSSTEPSKATTPHGAPKVEDPIDVQKYLESPCEMLTKQHWKRLGATEPGNIVTKEAKERELFGPICSWTDSSNNAGFSPGFLASNKNGLDDLYRGKKQGQFDYFIPTNVDGYPAVYLAAVDLRETGSCGIAVGVTDNLAMLATTQGYSGKDEACSKAKATATAAIETMKQGA